jgi:hypothetical protein
MLFQYAEVRMAGKCNGPAVSTLIAHEQLIGGNQEACLASKIQAAVVSY